MIKPTILLVDNDKVALELTKEFLEAQGYNIQCAVSPEAAIAILETETVSLALIDYRLIDDEDDRDNDGPKLAEVIRNDFGVSAIIFTKFDRYEYAVQALRPQHDGLAPALDFVVKQQGLEVIAQAVKRALPKSKVFLSYCHRDEKSVTQLYERLSRAGFSPWLDKKCLQGGEKWAVAIRKAIREADCFVLCISKQSINRRGFIQREIRLALEILDECLEDDIYLIPARLENCQIAHEQLQELQWIDMYQPDGFRRLTQAIRTGVARRARRP